jgi:DNA-binding transcriptional MerR regulator
MTEERHYSIGAAVALLQGEFPDVSASSLRFLEREGLLHSQRTAGGHRIFSETDLARVRLIKRLQGERHYPLETIRHMLVKLERAKDPEAEMAFLESLYSPLSYDPDFVPLTQEELARRTGLSVADVERLEKMGLVFPNPNGNGRRRYDEDDLKIAQLVAREMQLGARLKDFAIYAGAMQALMRAEFELFHKLVGEGEPAPERARQLKETADLVHALLRAKLMRQLIQGERG